MLSIVEGSVRSGFHCRRQSQTERDDLSNGTNSPWWRLVLSPVIESGARYMVWPLTGIWMYLCLLFLHGCIWVPSYGRLRHCHMVLVVCLLCEKIAGIRLMAHHRADRRWKPKTLDSVFNVIHVVFVTFMTHIFFLKPIKILQLPCVHSINILCSMYKI